MAVSLHSAHVRPQVRCAHVIARVHVLGCHSIAWAKAQTIRREPWQRHQRANGNGSDSRAPKRKKPHSARMSYFISLSSDDAAAAAAVCERACVHARVMSPNQRSHSYGTCGRMCRMYTQRAEKFAYILKKFSWHKNTGTHENECEHRHRTYAYLGQQLESSSPTRRDERTNHICACNECWRCAREHARRTSPVMLRTYAPTNAHRIPARISAMAAHAVTV